MITYSAVQSPTPTFIHITNNDHSFRCPIIYTDTIHHPAIISHNPALFLYRAKEHLFPPHILHDQTVHRGGSRISGGGWKMTAYTKSSPKGKENSTKCVFILNFPWLVQSFYSCLSPFSRLNCLHFHADFAKELAE